MQISRDSRLNSPKGHKPRKRWVDRIDPTAWTSYLSGLSRILRIRDWVSLAAEKRFDRLLSEPTSLAFSWPWSVSGDSLLRRSRTLFGTMIFSKMLLVPTLHECNGLNIRFPGCRYKLAIVSSWFWANYRSVSAGLEYPHQLTYFFQFARASKRYYPFFNVLNDEWMLDANDRFARNIEPRSIWRRGWTEFSTPRGFHVYFGTMPSFMWRRWIRNVHLIQIWNKRLSIAEQVVLLMSMLGILTSSSSVRSAQTRLTRCLVKWGEYMCDRGTMRSTSKLTGSME